jgi:F-type H+-transporting ATPase subunit delta
MIPGSLARRYARALLQLAKAPSQRDKFGQDLDTLCTIVTSRDEGNTQVLQILASDRFSLGDRKRLLGTLARRIPADPTVVKFLEVVMDNGRVGGLPDIARAYRRMADDAAGRVQAEITSAVPLAPDALARIKSALEKASGKQVVATTKIDPELIGGVVAKVGSYVVDGSVRTSLQQLRASLRS